MTHDSWIQTGYINRATWHASNTLEFFTQTLLNNFLSSKNVVKFNENDEKYRDGVECDGVERDGVESDGVKQSCIVLVGWDKYGI